MPAQRARTVEEVARDEITAEVGKMVKKVAADIGPPAGMTKMSTAKEIALYWLRDNQVDEATFQQQLMQTGIPPQLVQGLQVVQERPDLAPAYLQPVADPELAQVLTRVAEYPYRLEILEPIDDPIERAKKAEYLASKGPGAAPAVMAQAEAGIEPAVSQPSSPGAPPAGVVPPATGVEPATSTAAPPSGYQMSPQQMAGG